MGEAEAEHRGRIISLDLARGLAIVFMVFQHAVLIYATDQGEDSLLGRIVLLLGSAPAAPVFLFIMGIFLGRSNQDVGPGIRRGLKLVALGYLLNLLRSTLPWLIVRHETLSLTASAAPLASFWAVDILQMAGLSFILLTLLRVYAPTRWAWAVLAAVVAFGSPLAWQWDGPFGVYGLWGGGDHVYFPLFPWIIYPLAGMVYSPRVLETKHRGSRGGQTVAIGTLLLAIGIATFFVPDTKDLAIGQYLRDGPGSHLTVVGFIVLWVTACGRLAKRWAGSGGLKLLCFWSRHVTAVYFVHWVLIGWAVLLLGRNRYASHVAVGMGIAALFLTHVAVGGRLRWTQRRRERYKLA